MPGIFPLGQRAQEFQERFFRAQLMGVHLRCGDRVLLHPDTTGNLETALRQGDEWLEFEPDAGIFLCTDDGSLNPYSNRALPAQNIHAQFVRRYDARVVFTAPGLDRRSPHAIEDALVGLAFAKDTIFRRNRRQFLFRIDGARVHYSGGTNESGHCV